ncbi:MAG: hypothetical protein VW518_00160 [Burkholderiaceae bacterium]
MEPRSELEELRRLEELERRANELNPVAIAKQKQAVNANLYAGQDVNEMGTLSKMLGGAKAGFDKAAYGLGTMFPDLPISQDTRNQINQNPVVRGLGVQLPSSADMQRDYRQGQDFINQAGAPGTIGSIASEVAVTSQPAYRGQQLLQMAGTRLPNALGLFRRSMPSTAASSGITSAALTPQNRTQEGLGGAAGGAFGDVAGRALTRTLGGLVRPSVSQDARTLMDQGVRVPMWRAMDSGSRSGRLLRDAAERAKALPYAGDIIRNQERRAFEDFNRAATANATPPMPVLDDAGRVLRWENRPVREIGAEAIQTLGNRFDDAYGALYAGRGIPVDDVYAQEMRSIVDSTAAYYPRIADDIAAAFRQADDTIRRGTETTTRSSAVLDEAGRNIRIDELGHAATSPEALKQALRDLETRVKAAFDRGDGEAGNLLNTMKDSIESLRVRGLPPEVSDQAAAINRAYASFKQLQRGMSSTAAQNAGVLSPSQLLTAIKAMDRSPAKSRFSKGRSLNQENTLRASRVLGDRLPATGPGTAEKLLPIVGFGAPMLGADLGATALLGTQTGQRFLMGDLPGQAGVRRFGNEYLIPALRQGGMMLGN